ncbi:hypothetical protein PQG02_24685 [Nostoc sp. UHCC 0926]|uniref:hypothetical protein n=1 Tax=unclassified Nostoc TaxID=2593658 RepID=UPI002360E33A|nr:hypothetical protein [Nostoc sp. UHCC 0926]WDD31851.1 hypothetical protein PQG02_24685 [Nostoc sp. UHCC 0926]
MTAIDTTFLKTGAAITNPTDYNTVQLSIFSFSLCSQRGSCFKSGNPPNALPCLCGSLRQALRLGAVAHGGNPLQPFRHPTAGAIFSQREKIALLHRFASTLKKLTLIKSFNLNPSVLQQIIPIARCPRLATRSPT